jgi:hypothetical protein
MEGENKKDESCVFDMTDGIGWYVKTNICVSLVVERYSSFARQGKKECDMRMLRLTTSSVLTTT